MSSGGMANCGGARTEPFDKRGSGKQERGEGGWPKEYHERKPNRRPDSESEAEALETPAGNRVGKQPKGSIFSNSRAEDHKTRTGEELLAMKDAR